MDSGSVSDEEASLGYTFDDPMFDEASSALFLPTLPSSLAECCQADRDMFDGDSVWSERTRLPSQSWNWDDSGCMSMRSSKGAVGSWDNSSNRSCQATSLSFTPGQVARPEYSSPESPMFYMASRTIHENVPPEPHFLDQQLARQEDAVRTRRSDRPSAPNTEQSSTSVRDVIAPSDVAEGEFDIQGIPWPRFSISRLDYRNKRVREYNNYNNVNWSARLEMKRRMQVCKVEKIRTDMWMFNQTFRTVSAPTIDHFQLRQLLWSTSNVASYYVSNSTLYEFNRTTNVSKRVLACSAQQMACCHVDFGLAATGSFDSGVTVTRLNEYEPPTLVMQENVSREPNSITNHVVIASADRLVVGNNDSHVSEFDLHAGKEISKFQWTSPVNHVSVGPASLACLSGDSCDISLMDRLSGEIAFNLAGHLDFSFCSSWSPLNPFMLCTGSQDGTCRVWDIRKPESSLACLGSLLGAVRSAKFSPDGRFLAFTDPADFVHVYDVRAGLIECQLLDFFGNIAGIAFTPDSSKLSVSLADTMFGCLIDFQVNSLPINTIKHSA